MEIEVNEVITSKKKVCCGLGMMNCLLFYDGHDTIDAVLLVSNEEVGFTKVPPKVSERVSRSARGALA